MGLILLAIGILTLGISTIPIVLAIRFIRYVDMVLKSSRNSYTPRVTIIVPCKGLDPNFDGNIKAFLQQDYPDYRVLFVTATDDDPAYHVLEQIIKKVSEIPTKLLTAGITQGRSQKINNQLRALEEVRNDTEILVFLDSDICPHSKFLSNLVAPLENPKVGVATGFRWYLPVKGGFASLLRSTWNGGGVVFVSDDKTNYAWGGAMAIRKKVFEKVQVAKAWESALTDDFPLTLAVREAGYTVNFVPRCLVASHEDCTFSEMLEWTNRQTII
ncbi:glycosyltransferase, partial [bacterium]|nr:glycosyltransferase [bacterium]